MFSFFVTDSNFTEVSFFELLPEIIARICFSLETASGRVMLFKQLLSSFKLFFISLLFRQFAIFCLLSSEHFKKLTSVVSF